MINFKDITNKTMKKYMFIFVSFFTLHSYWQVNPITGKQILSNPYIRDTTYSKPKYKLDTTSWRSKNWICGAAAVTYHTSTARKIKLWSQNGLKTSLIQKNQKESNYKNCAF